RQDGSITYFWETLFQFEAYLSINIGITQYNLNFPHFTDKHIKLVDFYHPLIKNPIKNDFETTNNVIVLNGPNMSGKSTFLKAVGLCIYFSHLGIGIPASYAEIPFFNHFSVKINKRDDILQGYSHFMTEIRELKTVVINASKGMRCFAVFDELFSGTNVEDGFEILKTTINGLNKYDNSYFFISTHIQKLKDIPNGEISNYFIECKMTNDWPTF